MQLPSRSVTGWIALLSFVLQSGCATLPSPPSTEMRAQVRTIAIVSARYAPESSFVSAAPGQISQAGALLLIGGGLVLAVGLVASAMSGGGTGLAVLGVLYTGVLAGIGSPQETVPSGKEREIEQAIAHTVGALDTRQALARHLASAVEKEPGIRLQSVSASDPETPTDRPSYAGLRTAGVDTVLEISVAAIGFEVCADPLVYPKCPGKAEDPLISLFVKAHARVVRVTDGAEIYARTFWYESRPRTNQEWAERDGQPLAQAFEFGWRDLAGRIVDELFLVTPVPLPTPGIFAARGNPYADHCWLRPLYPEKSNAPVDSLRPHLRWESFPRALDHERGDPALIAMIRDVTYDLKIWEPDDYAPGQLVYERYGLPEPSHRVEISLQPDRSYFWSFRARFTIDGRPMATRWASGSFSGSWVHGPRDEQGAHLLEVCHSDQISFHNYYRFMTPEY